MSEDLLKIFQEQMKQKGFDLNSSGENNLETGAIEKSELLEALKKQVGKQCGPSAHSDHESFPRHRSNSATVDEKINPVEVNLPLNKPKLK